MNSSTFSTQKVITMESSPNFPALPAPSVRRFTKRKGAFVPVNAPLKGFEANLSSDNSGDEMDYTVVSNKRGAAPSSSDDERRTMKRVAQASPTLTANRFSPIAPIDNSVSAAADQTDVAESDTTTPKKYKIPPVCVKNFATHKALITYISQITKSFVVTPRRDFSRVQLEEIADYRALTSALEEDSIEHYTFSEARPKTQRFVLRGLPSNADPAEIREELEWLGIPTRSVTQLHRHIATGNTEGRKTLGDKLPLYTVALAVRQPGTKPVDLTGLVRLQNCVVTVEAPRDSTPKAPMCFRCQHIGHVSEFCRRQARCVSCGQDHASNTCTVPMTVKATCANCGGEHPANYRGCEYLRRAQARHHQQRPSLGSAVNGARNSEGQRRRLEVPDRTPAKTVSSTLSFARATAGTNPFIDPAPEPIAEQAQEPDSTNQSDAGNNIFGIPLAGIDWRSILLTVAKAIADAKIHPTITMLAQLAPTLIATLMPQNA